MTSFIRYRLILALTTEETMARLVDNSDAVAELRIAKDTPTLFLEMRPVEQADWVGNLVDRVDLPDALAPAICLLDSGHQRGRGIRLASLRRCFGRSAAALARNRASSRSALGGMDTGDACADRGGCSGAEGGHASPIWMGRTRYRSRSDERDGRCDLDG
jgi:hypothetical protein